MSIYEWEILSNLLQKGYALADACYFIHSNWNIKYYLEKGYTIQDIFIQGNNDRFYKHLEFFLQFMQFSDAIDVSLKIYKFQKDIQKKFIQKMSYPSLILLISFCTLYIFSHLIIPQMINHFELEQNFLFILLSFLQCFSTIFIFILIGCCMVFLVCYFHKKSFLLMMKYCICILNLPKEIISYFLSSYLCEIMKIGCSTRQSFLFLSQLSNYSLIKICAEELMMHLEQGKAMKDTIATSNWLCQKFKQSWNIGDSLQNLQEALKQYVHFQEITWFQKIKKTTIMVQVISYSFVAITVLCFYQIMLVPLQILETI